MTSAQSSLSRLESDSGAQRRARTSGRPILSWFVVCAGLIWLGIPPVLAQDEPSESEPAAEFVLQVVKIKGTYGESPYPEPIDPTALLFGGSGRSKSIYKLCDYLGELAADDTIDGVYFDISDPGLGISGVHLAELDRAMQELKAAGKQTVAWLEVGSTAHYSVAAACDQVYIANMGMLDLPSRAMSSLHFRDAMDFLGVKASVARAGDFKGAVEPYTNSKMSDHLRRHYLRMLESLNADTVNRWARSRGMTADQVREIQSKRLFVGRAAVEAGLADALAPYGGERDLIESRLGKTVEWRVKRPRPPKPFNFFEFMTQLTGGRAAEKLREPGLAVLHLRGQIVDGSSRQSGMMVSGPMVEAIHELIDDDNVRGVVLRVDSPGGSATASEAIRRALVELAAKKPVVVSMGRVAASGGYWISCLGRPIMAEHSTITGSIGVFAMKLSFGTLLRRVGVHVESIVLDESAGAFAIDRGWTSGEEAMLSDFIGQTYDRFLKLVARSRSMDVAAVDKVGGGRVWSGAQAQAIGLVDQLGGLDAALAMIRREAGLEEGCPTIQRPSPPPPMDLSSILSGDTDEVSAPFGQIRSRLATSLGGAVMEGLQKQGFDFSIALKLVEQSLSGRMPSVQLLNPEILSIR